MIISDARNKIQWFADGLGLNIDVSTYIFPKVTLEMATVAFDYGLVPFVLVDDGGDSAFERVVEKWDNDEPIPIWTGASEGTIWGGRLANWLFRVWHDSIHCKESVGFGLNGEIDAAIHHMEQARKMGYSELAAVCWLEVAGQASWHHATGGTDFPPQSFTRTELDRMGLHRVGWTDIRGEDFGPYMENGTLPFDG